MKKPLWWTTEDKSCQAWKFLIYKLAHWWHYNCKPLEMHTAKILQARGKFEEGEFRQALAESNLQNLFEPGALCRVKTFLDTEITSGQRYQG